jgi:hypothetical protein
MWWAAFLVTAAYAQTPVTPVPAQPRSTAVAPAGRPSGLVQNDPEHPDVELLRYLGEFEDAADGLDPLAFTDDDRDAAAAVDANRNRRR